MMRGVISKIHPLKLSRNGNYFMRVEFKLENGEWAKSDLCPDFRNFNRWCPILKVGVMLEGLSLKSKGEVNADSWPKPYETPVSGHWIENKNGNMEFIKDIKPDVTVFSLKSETDKSKNYNVALLDSGFICDCPSYQHRGMCKHVSKMAKINQLSLI